jgi:CheY-like chemotaxis protein
VAEERSYAATSSATNDAFVEEIALTPQAGAGCRAEEALEAALNNALVEGMTPTPRLAGSEEMPEKRKLIAIVEDDASIVGLLHAVLEGVGQWRVHVFEDGQDAKDQLPALGADLILLDVSLPGLDGTSLYRILRGHSRTKNIPIIVVTGSRDWELQRMGLQTALLLRKPFKLRELLDLIHDLLADSQRRL